MPLTVWDQAGWTLYLLNYPSLATTHSMRSGRPDALLTALSWLSCCSQCDIRQAGHSTDWTNPARPSLKLWDHAGQMVFWLSYPSLAATHSVRSGRQDALLIGLSRLSHCSQCKIRQARHSTDWAIPARPPLTVWDQAGQMLYQMIYPDLATNHCMRSGRPDALPTELSWLDHHSQCEIRQARHSTDWTILARMPLTVLDHTGQMLYQLSYPSLAATHSVRSGRPDTLLTELSWLGCHSQCEIRQAGHSTYWTIPAWPPLTV